MKNQINLAVIEEKLMQNNKDHQVLKDSQIRIENKLDEVIETKADKSVVSTLENRLWWIVGIIIISAIGFIVWFIEKVIERSL